MKSNPFLIKFTRSVLIVLMLLLIMVVHAGAQTIQADSLKFPIGKQVHLTLRLPLDNSAEVQWPLFADTITKSIEIISKSAIDTITDEGSQQKLMQQIITITSFDTGFIVVPPVAFKVTNTDGSTRTLQTEPLLMEVYKVKVDPAAEIKDIKPILKAPLTIGELLPWLLGLAALIILGYTVYFFMKNKRKRLYEPPQPKVTVPAWEIALQQLEELKQEKLWQKNQVKEYYTRLTDILRDYFERMYRVNAAEMTSSEIMEAVAPHIRDERPVESLRNVLYLSDMAKFAKAQPGAAENEQSIVYGIEIVKYTIPSKSGGEVNSTTVAGIPAKGASE